MNSFQNKILELRKSKNYTQEDLAKILHVSRQAISKWENGLSYPSMDIMNDIAHLFNLTIDELFDQNDLRINTFKNNSKIRSIKKLTFIISIIVFIVLTISIVSLIKANKAVDLNNIITEELPEDNLVGFVVVSSNQPQAFELNIDDLDTLGYPYYIQKFKNGVIYSEQYGLFNTLISSNYINSTIFLNQSKFSFAMICPIYKKANVNEIYIDYKSSWSSINNIYKYSKSIKANNSEDISFDLTLQFVDTLESINLIEYDMNNNKINEMFISNTDSNYTLSSDCLYIIFENKYKNKDNQFYYTRDVVTSGEINKGYIHILNYSNELGFVYKSLILKPEVND